MKHLMLMSLMFGLVGCGKPSNAVIQDFHTHGSELMETKSCQWYMQDPDSGNELHITLDKQYYSDGSIHNNCQITKSQSYIDLNCLPDDQVAVYYFYFVTGAPKETSFVDLGQCVEHFYDYQ